MSARLLLVAALLILQACIREQGTPSVRFKRGGSARSRAWKELEKDFRSALDSTPKTREGLSAVALQWLGPSESTALNECLAMLTGPGMDGPVQNDVMVYLLERDADGFSRYLVVDFRKPEQGRLDGAALEEERSSGSDQRCGEGGRQGDRRHPDQSRGWFGGWVVQIRLPDLDPGRAGIGSTPPEGVHLEHPGLRRPRRPTGDGRLARPPGRASLYWIDDTQ